MRIEGVNEAGSRGATHDNARTSALDDAARDRTAARWLGAVFAYVRRTKADGWEPEWQPETPDIEAVRRVAFEMRWDHMHFHEVAMADPFKAEAVLHEFADRLTAAVGYPTGTKTYTTRGAVS